MSKNLGIQIGGLYKKSQMEFLKSLGWALLLLVGGCVLSIYTFTNSYAPYVILIGIGLCLLGAWMLYSVLLKPMQISVYEYGIKITKGSDVQEILFNEITEVNWYITSDKNGETTTLTIRTKENNKSVSISSSDVQNISSLIQKVEDPHFNLVTKDITVDNIASKTISFGYVKLENGYFTEGKKKIALNQFDRYSINDGQITFFGVDGTKFKYTIVMAANLKILLYLVNNVISFYKQQYGGTLSK